MLAKDSHTPWLLASGAMQKERRGKDSRVQQAKAVRREDWDVDG